MNLRDSILSSIPFNHNSPQLDPQQLSLALAEIKATGIIDPEDARVAALSWCQGVETDTVLALFRRHGTERILRQELIRHEPGRDAAPLRVSSSALLRLTPFVLTQELGNPTLGWPIALLLVAVEADFPAVVAVLDASTDPSRIATYFVASKPFCPPDHRASLIGKLLSLRDADDEDSLSLEVAVALFSFWLEIHIEHGNLDLEAVFAEIEQHNISGATVLGAVLSFPDRYASSRLKQEVTSRATDIELRINHAGMRVFADGSSVKAAFKAEGVRRLDVLAAISRWRSDPDFSQTASKAIGKNVGALLDSEFASRQHKSIEEASLMSRVSKWSLAPLIASAIPDGIAVDVFLSYFDSLATDSFSKMTRFRTFLEDRQRAIILVALCGFVAAEREDAALLAEVKSAAELLSRQPAGSTEVLEESQRHAVKQRCGIDLPER